MADIAQHPESKAVMNAEPQLSPFALMDRLFDDSADPFNLFAPSLFGNRRLSSVSSSFPKVDVAETDAEIRVTANIPGIDPDKIDIEVGADYLSLSGRIDKESSDEDRSGKVYRYEREYGEFRREFSLPARVDKEGIVAKAKNGVLTITLPKSESERPARVKIETE